MKKIKLFLLASLLLNNIINAQSWVWANNTAASSSREDAYYVKTDATGNVYVAGVFYGPTVTFGSVTLSNSGSGYSDVFLVKYSSSGSVIWAKRAGGSNVDEVTGLVIDAAGNILISGYFASSSITFGTTTLINTSGGTNDTYTTKYDPNGNVLWSKAIGGWENETSYSLCTDAANNVYIVGAYNSYTLSAGSFSLINSSSSVNTYDGYIIKYNSVGNTAWANSISGLNYFDDEFVNTVISDVSGANIYVTGSFMYGVAIGTNTITNGSNTERDLFFAKFNASTGNHVTSSHIAGVGLEQPSGMARDASNNIYITGIYDSGTLTFGTHTINNNSATVNDIFLTKYNTSGVAQWAVSAGNSSDDISGNVCVDATGNVYIAGTFKSNTLSFGSTTLTNFSPNTYYDAYFAKYNSSGTPLTAVKIGNNRDDIAHDIAVDQSGNIFLVGAYSSSTISFGSITLGNSSLVYNDAFVAKYGASTTNLNETNRTDNISVFPNPTSNSITINSHLNSKVKIFNSLGEVVYDNVINSNNYIIEMTGYSNGIYFLQIDDANIKIIKTN